MQTKLIHKIICSIFHYSLYSIILNTLERNCTQSFLTNKSKVLFITNTSIHPSTKLNPYSNNPILYYSTTKIQIETVTIMCLILTLSTRNNYCFISYIAGKKQSCKCINWKYHIKLKYLVKMTRYLICESCWCYNTNAKILYFVVCVIFSAV